MKAMTLRLLAACGARVLAGLGFWALAVIVGKAYLHQLTITILVTEAVLFSVGGILIDFALFVQVVKALADAIRALAPALRAALTGVPLPSAAPPPPPPVDAGEAPTPEES